MGFLSVESVLAMLVGALYGALFGAIPGLTATLAVALFIPLAFFLDPALALPAIIAIASVAIYAGDVGSAVARIPGTPASAAYVEELYTLCQGRGPAYALGISAMGSAVGGILGTAVLVAGATGIASVAAQFSSYEYFWVAVLGLAAGVFASGQRPIKPLVSLLIGLLLATVGIDPTLGYPRFHFGSPTLLGGVNYVVAMIGLFGFSEVLRYLMHPPEYSSTPLRSTAAASDFFLAPWKLIRKAYALVARSSLAGIVVGFLPGAGADVGAWVATSIEKMNEKHPPSRVVLAGASSNNAAVASAWIPALSLGLPGDTVTAMVLGVFLMKGITPGPLLFEGSLPLVLTLYGTFLVANVLLLPGFGYLSARVARLALQIPLRVLISIIAAICVAGAYAINNNPIDVVLMGGMGAVALLLKRGGFPLAQVVLGMVLGPILEHHFMVSAIKSSWDLTRFFDRPIALVLMALTLGIIAVGLRVKLRKGRSLRNLPEA